MSDNFEVLLNQFIENTDSFRNLTRLYEWVIKSFTLPICSNHWFIKEQNECVACRPAAVDYIHLDYLNNFHFIKKKTETVYTEKGFSLYSAALQLFFIILKTCHSS